MKRKNELITKKSTKKIYFFKNNYYVFINYLKFFKLFCYDFYTNFSNYLNFFFLFYKNNFSNLLNFFYKINFCFSKFNYFFNNRFLKFEFFLKIKSLQTVFFCGGSNFTKFLSFNIFYDSADGFVQKIFDFVNFKPIFNYFFFYNFFLFYAELLLAYYNFFLFFNNLVLHKIKL